jgi:hypothetical protein
MVVGQATPGAGMVGATSTSPGREYGIKGSFDKDYINEILAGSRSRVDDILNQSNNESRRDAIIRKNQERIRSDLEYLNETIGDPIDREAERDRANPRFDPYDAERRQRLLNDYKQMNGKQSLAELAGRYGADFKFGHKPYQQAKELGYLDSEILSFLDENSGYRSSNLYNELKSGNVDMNNIASNEDRGMYGFRNIIDMM